LVVFSFQFSVERPSTLGRFSSPILFFTEN
jgi:hypothetical protein